METARTEKELIDATRPFVGENLRKSWWYLVSTLAAMLVLVVTAGVAGHFGFGRGHHEVDDSTRHLMMGAAIGSSLVAGLVVVRMFILYHDFLHGALLRRSSLAKVILYTFGIYVLTPPKVWRETHNYHHAHTAKIVGSHVGSYAMVTPALWARMSASERFVYKAIRHPLTILFGYFTIFAYGMCVSPLLRAGRKNWDSALALMAAAVLSAALIGNFGFAVWYFGYFLPLAVATASGAYLFYAQHNFPDIYVQPRESWSYSRAALESSSYMKMGRVMEWFTGNIGYHHVHHLNPTIPFYRLPEAMAAIEELQHPHTTTLHPKDILANFRLKLWDPDAGKMVGFPS